METGEKKMNETGSSGTLPELSKVSRLVYWEQQTDSRGEL